MPLTYECGITTAPHRNRKYLEEAIESLRVQGVEPILSDNTKHWFSNWNDMIDNCKSDLLFIAHDDDIYGPEYISAMVEYMEKHPQVVACFCMDKFIDAEGRRIAGGTTLPFPEQDTYDFKFVLNNMVSFGNFLRCETVCLRVALVGDIRYTEKIAGGAGDTVFWYDILNKHPIGIVNRQLVSNRQHTKSQTEPQRAAVVPDHWAAMDHAVSLRPDALEWDKYIALETVRKINKHNKEAADVKARCETATKVKLIVVHEPPDNAGTGVVAAHRCREFNRGEPGQVAYYVFPNKDLTAVQEGWFKGCPIVGCPPDMFPLVVKRFKPAEIEYHHTLYWGEKVLAVETSAEKSLFLHDRWMWSEHPHEDGPFRDTRKFLKDIKIYGNSEWTCKEAREKLGVEVELFDPFVPLPSPAVKFRKRVGFFGGFSTTKGVHILLQAARQLSDILFVLFTQPPEGMMDGRQIHGHKNVIVMGAYSRSDLHLLVNLVDSVVVPSIFESHGLVKKEIESLGVPVISTGTGGMAGTVEPGDVQALVEALRCG